MKKTTTAFALSSLLSVAAASSCAAPQAEPRAARSDSAAMCSAATVPQSDVLAPERIVSVEARERRQGKQMLWRLVGVDLKVQPEPGLTLESLQLAVLCQQMASAQQPGNNSDPLAVPGVRAKVHSVNAGFLIRLEADNRAAAEEALRRSRALRG